MSAPPLRGAMIGAGFFAAHQAEAWRRLEDARITAVADLDGERARAFAARWGLPRAYTDAAEMIERERPAFIDIVTGPETHLALTRLGAAAGVHVICQKPMAPSMDECLEMVETCAAAGVRLLIHENWRWQPWYREIKRLAEAGAFGQLHHLSFRLRGGDGRGPEPYAAQPYFRGMKRFLVYETLIHLLDTFRYLAGEFRGVYCRTARINPVIQGEDYALVQTDFAGGAHGLIDANRISGPCPPEPAFGALRLEGDRGMVRMTPDGRLWTTVYGRLEQLHDYPLPEGGYRGDSVRAHQEHLMACLRSGRPAESEGREYLRTMAAVMACYESAETGLPVDVKARFQLRV